jgi:hypothetical protein
MSFTRRSIFIASCSVLAACSAAPSRSPDLPSSGRIAVVGPTGVAPVFRVVDARGTDQRLSTELPSGVRFGDDALEHAPVEVMKIELARAVAHHAKRAALERYLSTTTIDLIDFNIAIVGRSLSGQVGVQNHLPGIAAVHFAIASLLDRSLGASEADARISVRFGGETRFGYGVQKHLGPLPNDFMVAPIRSATDMLIQQVARFL